MKSTYKIGNTSTMRQRGLSIIGKIFATIAAIAILVSLLGQLGSARAAANLSVEILTSHNLVVDSNVLTPATYSPAVATVIGKFCNTGTTDLDNVIGYIGNYVDGNNDTPGVYPAKTNVTIGGQYYKGTYQFQHLGGIKDGTRFIGKLTAGQCVFQYWSFTYPRTAVDGSDKTIPTWGTSIQPIDDLYLDFDIWAKYPPQSATVATHTMYMRNEISAMANKIEPNGNPGGRWFNTATDTVNVGETITTNGILYRIGNVNKGFDNDNDGVPDYNTWLQPFGDPSYDPSCFRLISTTGVLTVTRSAGPDLIIPFENQLYFTDLPTDNTDVVGEVYYKFLALGGICSLPITPYQEAASGRDNEKFNGDYGAGVPALQSYDPKVTLDKTGNPTVSEPGTITYNIFFQNTSKTSTAGLTLSSGGVYAPLMIEDRVPNGLAYVCGSASATLDFSPNNGVTIYYSSDSGKNWSTSQPAGCATANPISSGPNNLIVIRWWLNNPIPAKNDSSQYGGTATFQAAVPSGYVNSGNSPLIENCATGSFGDAAPFAEDCTPTLVQGNNSIGDTVWSDNGAGTAGIVNNGIQESSEEGIQNITVWLYWDKDGDGILDDTDLLINTANTTTINLINGKYSFASLPDGNYIVKVDTVDTDLPTGSAPTSPTQYAVALDPAHATASPVNNTTSDFGFGPTFVLQKDLVSTDPAYLASDPAFNGENITFRLNLKNTLPGDGTASGFCQYTLWSGTVPAISPPASGTGNAAFANQANSKGAPDYKFSTTTIENNTDTLGLGGFNIGAKTGNITNVELLAVFKEIKDLKVADNIIFRPYYNGAVLGAAINHYGTAFTSPLGTIYSVKESIFGSGYKTNWTFADFNNDVTEVEIEANKGSGQGTSGDIALDSVAYIITTDQHCGGADTTIATLPLNDTFDGDILQFVSADPPVSSSSITGGAPDTVGTLTWDNLGPLYAGQTKTITVVMRAIATATPTPTTNTGRVTEAKFGNGRDVNRAQDDASLNILTSGSIAGRIWADAANPGTGWQNPTGYDAADTFIPGVKVNLYACTNNATGIAIAPPAPRTDKPCTDSSNDGSWTLIATKLTDSDGAYSFSGLRDGYYNVKVDETSLPAGFNLAASRRAEANPAGNGSGITCGTCDGQWNTDGADLGTFNSVVNTAGADNIHDVSFGYQDDGDNQGAVIGYVWNDQDRDGIWDSNEAPIAGVTVYLCLGFSPCNDANDNGSPAVTDANGRYVFGNLAPRNDYRTGVETSDLPGMTQSGDPDNSGACTICDNQTTTAFSVALNQVVSKNGSGNPLNFGYHGGLDIGDFVWTDWNGNGQQDPNEEGIDGVKVYLYRDIDGDGVIDAGVDNLIATQTTAGGGAYLFQDLPGNDNRYIVAVNTSDLPDGYAQTGDPDQGATTCTICDSKASVVLQTSDNLGVDFGYQPRGMGSIGDTVWKDPDLDGVQDASEIGVPGVTVILYQDQDGDGTIDPEDAVVNTTTTMGYAVIDGYIDISGNGAFGPEDDYTKLQGINVIDGKLDMNGNGVVNGADDGLFAGYRVVNGLLDLNNNGGVSTDDDGNLNGRYQFINLPEGKFIVQVGSTSFNPGGPLYGYSLTNNSDLGYNLSQTSYQVLLAAGQNYTEADFGFATGAIGDFVWQDNDGDGLYDPGEPGIPNVTITLYNDNDHNGVYSTGDTALGAPLSTNSTGYYEFTGLPAGDYVVMITTPPANHTLTGDPDAFSTDPAHPYPPYESAYAASYTGLDGQDGIHLRAGQIDHSADFGYQPKGVIGDTVWIDSDGDGVKDPTEQGIPNITVWLCATPSCNSGNAIRTAITDENGGYSFGGLGTNTYYVQVDTSDSDFPTSLSQTYDHEEGNNCTTCDSQATVSLDTGVNNGIDLTADFGYRFKGTNSINGTIWHDTDMGGQNMGVGDIDSGETIRYSNVPVYLWYCGAGSATCGDGDDAQVGTALTDASGNYTFTNLADGVYRVVVNSTAYSLRGTNPTTTTSYDGTPPADPAVSFSGGSGTAERDFGFVSAVDMGDLPSGYHNTLLAMDGARHTVPSSGLAVYMGASADPDLDPDGLESNLADGDDNNNLHDEDGVTWDYATWNTTSGGSINVVVGCSAACSGPFYLSAWIDWNQDQDFNDAGELISLDRPVIPGTQSFSFSIPAGTNLNGDIFGRFRLYTTSTNGFAQPTGLVFNGEVEDYQLHRRPTAVTMLNFNVTTDFSQVILNWQTINELNAIGFNVYRSIDQDGPKFQVNSTMIESQNLGGIGMPFDYYYYDSDIKLDVTYYYWLEFVDFEGSTWIGPVQITVGSHPLYLPAIRK